MNPTITFPESHLDRFRKWLIHFATLVVNGGKGIITNRIKGSGTEPVYIGWGTGVQTTALSTDTTLGPTTVERDVDLSGTSGTRTTGTSSQQTTTTTNDTYRVTGTRTATGAGTVTCAGLFDNATIGSGTMFLKGDFTGIGLSSGDSIAFTINCVLS